MNERLLSVRLLRHEVVVPGGTRTTSWYVRERGRWLPAQQHPSAQTRRIDSAPGTVWEEQLTLQLPSGTELKQTLLEPATHLRRSLFDYLRRQTHGAERLTRERFYTVQGDGKLRPKSSR